MANSLLDIKPHVVSRDLRGYSILFYGAPKSGKTTIATRFPNSLLLAFELGYNALPGVKAKPMKNWRDMKTTLKELEDEQVKQIFSNIIIDTGDLAYDYCEKYVCNQNEVNDISDLPFGKGYSLAMKEFDEAIRTILRLGYGCIIISHATDKTFKDSSGVEFNQIVPTISNKGRLVCERTCDIIAYSREVEVENGLKTMLFMRGTPRFIAGSRFKYTPDMIEFTYDNLVNAIRDAIDKEASEHGNQFVTDEVVQLHADLAKSEDVLDFDTLQAEFQSIVGDLMTIDSNKYQKEITVVVEKYLGVGKKVSECTSKQNDQISLINIDLKEMLSKLQK